MQEKVIDKLIRYVKIDTQSDPKSKSCPSTEKQFDLARLLVKELQDMGVKDVELDENCYVMATIPSNIPESHPAFGKVPNIGFIAHVDTSPDVTGANVNPQVIEHYQGQEITLGTSGVILTHADNPNLSKCIGHTLMTTDGTTLLGSDDKSGVAAIMQMTQILMSANDYLHGNIRIGFTPDEEIGRGADKFDIAKFNCQYAYTIDGDMPGGINKETFSADSAWIRCYGKEVHPGMAKDIMVNSMRAMAEIITRMPKDMAPETTEGYEQYIHPHSLSSSVGMSELFILLRSFKSEDLVSQKELLEKIISEVEPLYPKTKIELKVSKSYRNMHDYMEGKFHGCDYMFEAAEKAGVNPYWEPIRGGTDGSRLTEMGLPTPNIFTGGQNFHSVTEWVSVTALEKAVETMLHLCNIWVEKNK